MNAARPLRIGEHRLALQRIQRRRELGGRAHADLVAEMRGKLGRVLARIEEEIDRGIGVQQRERQHERRVRAHPRRGC